METGYRRAELRRIGRDPGQVQLFEQERCFMEVGCQLLYLLGDLPQFRRAAGLPQGGELAGAPADILRKLAQTAAGIPDRSIMPPSVSGAAAGRSLSCWRR